MSGWPDDEEILARFRRWLTEVRAEAEAAGSDGETGESWAVARSGQPVGLLQLVGEFTALRHELKLQTKSSRSLEEQTAQAIAVMQDAAETLHLAQSIAVQAEQKLARPLVEALIDLDEALARGRAAIESARRRVGEESDQLFREELDRLLQAQPWWRRWAGRAWLDAVRQACACEAASRQERLLESLAEGYDLIRQRLQRTLSEARISRIQSVGQPFDPNTMVVVELADAPDLAPGAVAEEVRPGYTWQGRVVRFAEVRAVGGKSIL